MLVWLVSLPIFGAVGLLVICGWDWFATSLNGVCCRFVAVTFGVGLQGVRLVVCLDWCSVCCWVWCSLVVLNSVVVIYLFG